MQLEHSFTVPVGVDDAWQILLDIERVGPCLPGATIDSVDGDDFTGSVKVKLGPINLTYKGKASFVEKDESAHRAVIDARGRDARGNGTAAAKVTATLSDSAGTTAVRVLTDLEITGKPAQFGRGVMEDVGNKLIGQFADCLARTLTRDGGTAAAAAAQPAPTGEPAGTAATAAAAEGAAAEEATAEQPPAKSAPADSPPADSAPADSAPADSTPADSTPADSTPAEQPPGQPAPAGDEATPSYSVPGGVPAAEPATAGAVDGHSPAPATEPRREVEPINLLESAGPAVAKRLAPIAVALVVVALAVRRRRGRRG